jgi:flagellar basal-body rod modification protein FlgD
MAIDLTGYTQQIVDGQLVNNTSSVVSQAKNTKSNSSMDQMDFINLLVAEMQNQDPLEPSSNTDYVAQMATFSQVQALDDMKTNMASMNADNLVGKYVTLNVTDAQGNVKEITGKVDFVTHENGKNYVSIEDELYNAEDLVTVMDEKYSEANVMAATFSNLAGQLPNAASLSQADAVNVAKLRYLYDSMDSYTKQFLSKSAVDKLETLEKICMQYGWGEYGAGGAYGPAAEEDGEATEGTAGETVEV